MRWWFVLRATEDILQNLEDQWERIQIQTSWKLESVVCNATKEYGGGISVPTQRSCCSAPTQVCTPDASVAIQPVPWLLLTMALLPLYKQSLSRRRGKKASQ